MGQSFRLILRMHSRTNKYLLRIRTDPVVNTVPQHWWTVQNFYKIAPLRNTKQLNSTNHYGIQLDVSSSNLKINKPNSYCLLWSPGRVITFTHSTHTESALNCLGNNGYWVIRGLGEGGGRLLGPHTLSYNISDANGGARPGWLLLIIVFSPT